MFTAPPALLAGAFTPDLGSFGGSNYSGNNSYPRSINCNTDMTPGGLLWLRKTGAAPNIAHLIAKRASDYFAHNAHSANATGVITTVAYTSTGFGISAGTDGYNAGSVAYTALAFRKAAGFLDVVDYTGNGVSGRTIAHALGQTPGCILIHRDGASWVFGHHQLNAGVNPWNYTMDTRLTAAPSLQPEFNNTAPDASNFTVAPGGQGRANTNGETYAAFLFAHDVTIGGKVQCGRYTGNGSTTGPSVALGWHPRFLLIKGNLTANWPIVDQVRSSGFAGNEAVGLANVLAADTSEDLVSLITDGFQIVSTSANVNTNATDYYYIAIR